MKPQLLKHTVLIIIGIILLSILLFTINCGDGQDSPLSNYERYYPYVPPDEQKIFFEFQYINKAWGDEHNGYYIDRDGNIYAYEHYLGSDDPWSAGSGYTDFCDDNNHICQYNEALLLEKFEENPIFVGTIDKDELMEMVALIEVAQAGEFSERKCTCADVGMRYLAAYSFNQPDIYTSVKLYVSGDCAYKNISDEAIILTDWLIEIFDDPEITLCGPDD